MKRIASLSLLVFVGALTVFFWRGASTRVEPCDYDTLQEACVDYLGANRFAARIIRLDIDEQKAVELLERIPPASDRLVSLGHEAIIAPTRALDESTLVKLWPYPADTVKVDSWERDCKEWSDLISAYLLGLQDKAQTLEPN